MFFVHQVVPGPEGHQVSIVRWGRDGHGTRAAHVGVTQLVGEDLQLVGGEAIVIPQHVVVGGPACSLKAGQRVREADPHERVQSPLRQLCWEASRRALSDETTFILLTTYHQVTAYWSSADHTHTHLCTGNHRKVSSTEATVLRTIFVYVGFSMMFHL